MTDRDNQPYNKPLFSETTTEQKWGLRTLRHSLFTSLCRRHCFKQWPHTQNSGGSFNLFPSLLFHPVGCYPNKHLEDWAGGQQALWVWGRFPTERSPFFMKCACVKMFKHFTKHSLCNLVADSSIVKMHVQTSLIIDETHSLLKTLRITNLSIVHVGWSSVVHPACTGVDM